MPTPEEIDTADGPVTIDVNGRLVHISRYRDSTYMGRSIAPGRWYHVLASDLLTTYGMIDYRKRGESYAFSEVSIGQGLGTTVGSLDEGIRTVVPN